MKNIPLPEKPLYKKGDKFEAVFEIKGCYPGYGNTLGNALRRVLLSSLPGYAVTKVKFKGSDHEFSTIPGVKENIVQIILNIKGIRFLMHKDEPAKVRINVKGSKEVKAKDIETPSSVEVVNPEALIATISDSKSSLEIEMTVEKGIGYSPAEEREDSKEGKELGVINIDSLFTPIKRVNYEVENMRVGKRTDFDKLTFTIETDGSVDPENAFKMASQILIKQFAVLAQADEAQILKEVEKEISKDIEEVIVTERTGKTEKKAFVKKSRTPKEVVLKIEDLNLSKRIKSILEQAGINSVREIAAKNEDELMELGGMGEKGIKEIKKAIGAHGLVLGG